MLRWLAAIVIALAATAGPAPLQQLAHADDADVDLLLVLAADVSRSVDERKFRLQREGYAAAISDPHVIDAIRSGPHQRIAVCFVEWSGFGAQKLVIDWTGPAPAAAEPGEGDRRRRLVQVWLTIVGALAAIWLLGFPLAALVTTMLYVRVVGGERWSLTLGVALATFLLFGGVFECALRIPFPEGLLGLGIPLPCGR